jgi:hypothetical protein
MARSPDAIVFVGGDRVVRLSFMTEPKTWEVCPYCGTVPVSRLVVREGPARLYETPTVAHHAADCLLSNPRLTLRWDIAEHWSMR